MSIEKKLKNIHHAVESEAKEKEEGLRSQIKKCTRQVNENTKFLSDLKSIKSNFKYVVFLTCRTDDFKHLLKTVFKAGRLVNEYKNLDLGDKPNLDFDIEFRNAKNRFKDMKLDMESDTREEINALLKNIHEMNKDKEFQFEIEKFEQKVREQDADIRIPCWMTKNVAEYANRSWKFFEVNMKHPFFAFSRVVYLPENQFLVIGGLNEIVEDKPHYSDQVLKVSEVVVSPLEHFYSVNQIAHLNRSRGWFACTTVGDTVFVFGGYNYYDREMPYWEKFNFKTDSKWTELAKMSAPRKNPCACSATDEFIYVFGGGNVKCEGSDTIEQYNIRTNTWNLLNCSIKKKISNSICLKVSDSKILILGGSWYEAAKTIDKSPFVFLMSFTGQKNVKQIKDSPSPLFSVYPAFNLSEDNDSIYIVNEDNKNNELSVVKYHIDRFLVNIK